MRYFPRILELESRKESRKLQHEIQEIREHYKRKIAQARKEGNREEVKSLESGEMHEVLMAWEEFDLLVTNELRAKASLLLLPLPPCPSGEEEENEWWRRGTCIFPGWLLTREGVKRVRAEIRQEQKEHREALLAWVPAITGILGALIGIVGVLTGLLALVLR